MRAALASGLDPERIGASLMALVSAAELLHHGDVRSTVRDYGHPASLEEEFVRDVLCASTEEVALKWFGGSAIRYARLAAELAGRGAA